MTDAEAKIIEAAKNWERMMRSADPMSQARVISANAELLSAVELDRQCRLDKGIRTFRDI